MYKFFIKYEILVENQCGFTQNIGATDVQYDLTNLIYDITDKNSAVSIDLSETFDAVDHKLLLDKLFRHGIL